MIVIHDNVEQGTEEWKELRAGLYTGSNADKLLMHAGKTKVVNGLVSKYALTENTNFGGTFHTKRGHLLEDEAIELYQEISGKLVGRPGFVTNTKFGGCGYSPDGLESDAVDEVKCFGEEKHLKIYHGEIPLGIMAQVQYGMLICERALARLIIYNPKLEAKLAFKVIEIRARRPIQQNFKRILKQEVPA